MAPRSAGSNLRPTHSMAVQGEWTLQLSDFNPTGGCNYSVNKSLQFTFKEGMRYAFSMSINGVEASQDPFAVVLTPADPIDVAINWLMAGMAAILGGILLSSNVMKHHWSGLTIALLFTLGLSIALPWMTLHQDFVLAHWGGSVCMLLPLKTCQGCVRRAQYDICDLISAWLQVCGGH